MRKKSELSTTEHALFGDEQGAALRAEVDDLRALVADLAQQLNSQYTTIAAHAEIARQQAEFMRDEAHANLERTRDVLIGLIEQVRGGARALDRDTWAPPGPSVSASVDRVADLEAGLARALTTIDMCFSRQRDLAATMEALLDTVIFEQRGAPALRLA